MNSTTLAEMLRHEWGIESFSSINSRSLVYNNIKNLKVLWFPMKTNISSSVKFFTSIIYLKTRKNMKP